MRLLGITEVRYTAHQLDEASLRQATTEDAFGEASFEVLKNVTTNIGLLGGAITADSEGAPVPWSREEAVFVGLIVRLGKLLVGFIAHTAEGKGELANHLLRSVAETATNLRYLLRVDNPEVLDRFVTTSFTNDVWLEDRIESNREARGGDYLPIEVRMLRSIRRMRERSGVDKADIPEKKRDWGGDMRAKLRQLGDEALYDGIFGGPSAYTHGSWHELYFHHLRIEEGVDGFFPEQRWTPPRPQSVTPTALLVAEAAVDYVDLFLPSSPDGDAIRARLVTAVEQTQVVERMHEEFLASRG